MAVHKFFGRIGSWLRKEVANTANADQLWTQLSEKRKQRLVELTLEHKPTFSGKGAIADKRNEIAKNIVKKYQNNMPDFIKNRLKPNQKISLYGLFSSENAVDPLLKTNLEFLVAKKNHFIAEPIESEFTGIYNQIIDLREKMVKLNEYIKNKNDNHYEDFRNKMGDILSKINNVQQKFDTANASKEFEGAGGKKTKAINASDLQKSLEGLMHADEELKEIYFGPDLVEIRDTLKDIHTHMQRIKMYSKYGFGKAESERQKILGDAADANSTEKFVKEGKKIVSQIEALQSSVGINDDYKFDFGSTDHNVIAQKNEKLNEIQETLAEKIKTTVDPRAYEKLVNTLKLIQKLQAHLWEHAARAKMERALLIEPKIEFEVPARAPPIPQQVNVLNFFKSNDAKITLSGGEVTLKQFLEQNTWIPESAFWKAFETYDEMNPTLWGATGNGERGKWENRINEMLTKKVELDNLITDIRANWDSLKNNTNQLSQKYEELQKLSGEFEKSAKEWQFNNFEPIINANALKEVLEFMNKSNATINIDLGSTQVIDALTNIIKAGMLAGMQESQLQAIIKNSVKEGTSDAINDTAFLNAISNAIKAGITDGNIITQLTKAMKDALISPDTFNSLIKPLVDKIEELKISQELNADRLDVINENLKKVPEILNVLKAIQQKLTDAKIEEIPTKMQAISEALSNILAENKLTNKTITELKNGLPDLIKKGIEGGLDAELIKPIVEAVGKVGEKVDNLITAFNTNIGEITKLLNSIDKKADENKLAVETMQKAIVDKLAEISTSVGETKDAAEAVAEAVKSMKESFDKVDWDNLNETLTNIENNTKDIPEIKKLLIETISKQLTNILAKGGDIENELKTLNKSFTENIGEITKLLNSIDKKADENKLAVETMQKAIVDKLAEISTSVGETKDAAEAVAEAVKSMKESFDKVDWDNLNETFKQLTEKLAGQSEVLKQISKTLTEIATTGGRIEDHIKQMNISLGNKLSELTNAVKGIWDKELDTSEGKITVGAAIAKMAVNSTALYTEVKEFHKMVKPKLENIEKQLAVLEIINKNVDELVPVVKEMNKTAKSMDEKLNEITLEPINDTLGDMKLQLNQIIEILKTLKGRVETPDIDEEIEDEKPKDTLKIDPMEAIKRLSRGALDDENKEQGIPLDIEFNSPDDNLVEMGLKKMYSAENIDNIDEIKSTIKELFPKIKSSFDELEEIGFTKLRDIIFNANMVWQLPDVLIAIKKALGKDEIDKLRKNDPYRINLMENVKDDLEKNIVKTEGTTIKINGQDIKNWNKDEWLEYFKNTNKRHKV